MVQLNHKRVYTPKKITILRSIGYGMSDMLGGASGTLTGTYLMFFLTTYAGLSAAQVGLILAFAKFADMFMVLIFGSLSDNLFNFKIGRLMGRRHLLILISAFMITICLPMLFFVFHGAFFYYLMAYFLMDLASTINGVAYETLATEMTSDYQKRVKLTSTRMFIMAFSTFAITALPAILLKFFGEETATAYTISGIIFGIICGISLLIVYFTTWELPPSLVKINKKKQKITFNSVIKTLSQYINVLKTKAVRYVVSIYFLSYFAKDCYGTAFLYFAVSILGLNQSTGQSILSISFVGMFVVIGAGFVMSKKGPKILWSISYSIILFVLIFYGVLYLTNTKMNNPFGIFMLFVIGFIWQIGRSLLEFTPWQVIPFVPDIDMLVCKRSRIGVIASIQIFTRKITGALGTILIGSILTQSGYVSGVITQTKKVENAIMAVLVLIPIILILICFWMINRFNINEINHKIIKDEISRLQNGGKKEDVLPKVKIVVEDLTGYKYSDIWNSNN